MKAIEAEYDNIIKHTKALMLQKNLDYGDAWRLMRLSSITDQLLVKVHRIRKIEVCGGHSEISEGIKAEYEDIINYAVFALITLEEKTSSIERNTRVAEVKKHVSS